MINLQVNQLSKQLDNFQLHNISFQIEAGTVMGFIGENGAGKTSTINCILQLLKQDSGSIHIFGEPFDIDAVHLKQQIGVVFDSLHFPTTMEVKELEKLYKTFYTNWDSEYFYSLLERLNVPKYDTVKKMSAGTQKKLTIALALSYHPKLLLLDEPTSQLDPMIREEILSILTEYMEPGDRSILFSSHITSDIEKIADTITLIRDGRIAFTENKDEMMFAYRTFKGTVEQSYSIPKKAIFGKRDSVFGIELLVKREFVPPSVPLIRAELEDIIVMRSKQLKQQEMVASAKERAGIHE